MVMQNANTGVKLQNWRGFPRIFTLKPAPMLEFHFQSWRSAMESDRFR